MIRRVLRPEEVIAFLFVLFMIALTLWKFSLYDAGSLITVRWTGPLLLFALGLIGCMIDNRITGLIRDWVPFFFVSLVYGNIGDIDNVLVPETIDRMLIRIDRILFGVDPALWMEQFVTPHAVTLFTYAYAAFSLYPFVLCGLLYFVKKNRRAFREVVAALALGFYLGYLSYLLLPAIGPRYAQASLFSVQLYGSQATNDIRATFDHLEPTQRDCFPSLHVGIVAIVLIFAYRSARPIFYVMLLPAILLFISTVYLRYHYVIDGIAGFIHAGLCAWAGPRLERWWRYE
jgi:membrane-associated phospholipid phosphatase